MNDKQLTFRWGDREFSIAVDDGQQKALADVVMERDRQDGKWGEQNHTPIEWHAVLSEEVGEVAQAALNIRFRPEDERPAYKTAEIVEHWLTSCRYELVQVAAVALAAIESLDRNELQRT